MAVREVTIQVTDAMARVFADALAREVAWRLRVPAAGQPELREQDYRDALYTQEEWRKAYWHTSRVIGPPEPARTPDQEPTT